MFVAFSLFLNNSVFAQISGIKTIPGDYATIAAAITDLNGNGVGPGGVTYNIAAGYTETITATLKLTISGTATSPIIFQKSGMGVNPKIIAYVGTATPSSYVQDGIWQLVGVSYVKINGIDLYDPNTTNPATMEYGYGLTDASGTNGCRLDTIKNCVITLNRNNNTSSGGSCGIVVKHNYNASSTSGANMYNIFYSNTIQNTNNGIAIYGNSTSYYDYGNVIVGDTILNFGGATGAVNSASGIIISYQWGITVSNNIINSNNGSGVNHPNSLYGILGNDSPYCSASFSFNKITLHGGGTTQSVCGIENWIGYNTEGTTASNSVNIFNNEISGCTYSTATSGSFYGIVNYATANVYIYNNKIINNTQTGTGDFVCIYDSLSFPYCGSCSNVILNVDCSNNLISNNTKTTSSSGTITGIFQFVNYINTTNPGSYNFYNNEINNLNIIGGTSGTCTIFGINTYISINIYKNKIHDLSLSTGGQGFIYGMYFNSTNSNIYKNKIYNLIVNASSASINGIYLSSSYANLYNNIIGNLQAPIANVDNSIIGIYLSYTSNVYYNTVYLNATSTGSNFGSSAIYASTGKTLTLSNNIFVNTSIPKGLGITAAYRRSDVTLSTYGASSNNNFFFAGTPGPNNLIYYDGTYTDQSLYLYKTMVAPRDSASKTSTAIPNFLSSTGTDSLYLHINGSLPSVLFSGGELLTGTVDDDFDGNIRYGSTGYVGNGTAPCIGADEFNSITTIAVNLGNDTTICAGSPLTLNAGYPGAKYAWSTGDTTQTIIVNTAGTYSVIVHNGLFQTGYDTINVYVAPSTPVSITITKSTDSICAGINVTYTATAVNGGTSPFYQWKVNGVNQGTNNNTFTYAPANNDSITCVVTSNLPTCLANNPATSNKQYMYVYPLLPASISIAANQNSVCTGTTITFTATPVNGGTLPNYQWMKNDTIINGETNSTYSSSTLASGDIIKCVMTSNATPCLTGSPATSNPVTMIINPILPVSVTISPNTTGAICAGTNVTFTATPVNGGTPTYHWYKNGTIISGQTNATYSSTTLANEDTITCIMTSTLNCISGSPATSNGIGMTVNPLPANAGTITGATTVCQGQSSVTYNVPTIANATSYLWTLPTGATGTSTADSITISYGTTAVSGSITVKGNNSCGNGGTSTFAVTVNHTYNLTTTPTICQGQTYQVGTHTYSTAGTYVDSLSAFSGCDSIITTNLTVNPIPPTPTITQTGNTLHSSAASGNQWYKTSGIITGATNQTYNPTANGYYYTIVTLAGCRSDSSGHYYYTTVGIEENENNNGIFIYPNPAKDNLTIETNSNLEQKIEIINLIGQTIYTSYINKKGIINTSTFAKGVYILKLSSDKETVVRKFVKE